MNELPDDTTRIIVGYLPPSDALQWSNTSKTARAKLSLTACRPRRILTRFSRSDRDDEWHYGFGIPVPREKPCHSALLSLTWRDQGWGRRGGRLVVEAEARDRGRRAPGRRRGENVVYASGVAAHAAQRLD